MIGEENPEDSRCIDVIIYDSSPEMPIVHILIEDQFEKVQLIPIRNFWLFQIDDISESMNLIELYLTPTCGPTQEFRKKLDPDQPFIFIDATHNEKLAPFKDFIFFFNTAIANGSLTFNFNSENQLKNLECFLRSFDDDYILWAMIYISSQNWYSLFKFNEKLSELLLELLTPFILKNYYTPPAHYQTFDQKAFHANYTNPHLKEPPLPHSLRFLAAEQYIDTFFAFIRTQIGNGFVYYLSMILDFDNDFPITANIPSFDPQLCWTECQNILEIVIDEYSEVDPNEKTEVYERVFYTYIAIMTNESNLNVDCLIEETKDILNCPIICKLLTNRMLLSKAQPMKPLTEIYQKLPMLQDIIQHVAKDESFIPNEWIPFFIESTNCENIVQITKNSLHSSIPYHFNKWFASVTTNGAMHYDEDQDFNQIVLHPGSILQKDVKIGDHSMLMSGAIALSGSELLSNTYAPRNGVVLRKEPPIDESVVIEPPVQIKRGVLIGENAVIYQNSSIGSGVIISKGACIGTGVNINSGCIILEDQNVPPRFMLPCGFIYDSSVIEFSVEIPSIIQRYTLAFSKFYSGFARIDVILDLPIADKTDLLVEYFDVIHNYPRQSGLEFAQYNEKISSVLAGTDIEIFSNKMNDIFGNYGILFALKYWETKKADFENVDLVVKLLCQFSMKLYTISISDFQNDTTAPSIFEICQKFHLMIENGIETERINSLKQIIYQACDDLLVRLSLVDNSSQTALFSLLQQIIELSHT